LIKNLIFIQIGGSPSDFPPHKRDPSLLAILKIHFLLSILEISNAGKRVFGGHGNESLNPHSGKGMKDEHGLLAWKFTEIKKEHIVLTFY
jgi:hypothetical protein